MTYYYVEIIVYLITIRFLKVYVDVQNVQLETKGFLSMVTTWHPTEKVNFKPVPFPFNKLQPIEECSSMKCFLLIQQSCNITHHFFSKHFDQCLTMYFMLKGYPSQVTLAICFLVFVTSFVQGLSKKHGNQYGFQLWKLSPHYWRPK